VDIREPGAQHPAEYREDTNPGAGRDLNVRPSERPEATVRTAYDDKSLHERLDLRDDELKAIPLIAEGTRLRQGATYLDLLDLVDFTATADMVVGERDRFAAKDEVSYDLWNRLRSQGPD
jgi:hypothetical protein